MSILLVSSQRLGSESSTARVYGGCAILKQMSSALLQELEEGIQALGEPRMRYYKVLSMFSFENGSEIHFGEGLASFCTDRQQYDQLKDFIKEQKKWVKTSVDDHCNLELRLWWLKVKLVEFGVFSPSEQRSIFPLMVL